MNYFFILFFLYLLSSSYSNPFTFLKKEYNTIKSECNNFINFIHEFHHIVGSKKLLHDCKENSLSYMVLPHDNNLPAFTLIHQKNKTNLNCNKDQNPELIILELETALSGYAAEEAFKKNSFLLRKLSDDDLNINTKSFFHLLLDHYYLKEIITDIKQVLLFEKEIDFNNIFFKKYIQKYDKKYSKNKEVKKMEVYIQKIYCQKNIQFLKIIYIIYEKLVKKYATIHHQDKFYQMLKNNNQLLSIQIFFLNDLKSLWENQKLIDKKDYLNQSNYKINEKAIIQEIINKKIFPLKKTNKNQSISRISQINNIYNSINKKLSTILQILF